MAVPAPPASLDALGRQVGDRVGALLREEQRRWERIDATLIEPFEALRGLVGAGGKRIRPAFCYWGWIAAGGPPDDGRIIDAGAALELVHTMAIVHDDVMDGSQRRRGQPCVHVAFAERHRERDWMGDARRFGDGTAILVGDLAFVYADLLLAGAPPAALQVFTELRLEVNMGQLLDLFATASGEASIDQARTISVYKSAKYTVERPLHLGAALAGGLDDLATPFSEFGLALGEAFQLRDDLLGAFGDPEVLGKAVGEDLREGKPTALYAIARERASGADAALLSERFGQPDLGPEDIVAMQGVFMRTGARATVEATIDSLLLKAGEVLEGAPLDPVSRAELGALAAFVAGRDH